MNSSLTGHTPSSPRRVLIVGAGMAGLRTAAELRSRGYAGQLHVVGDEPMAPYDRPPLSKELFTRTEPVWLADEGYGDLADLADQVDFGASAVSLAADDDEAHVELDDGRHVTADIVVLACGSRPRARPALVAAHRLHRAQDAARLRAAVSEGTHVLCLGGGWIGTEVASSVLAAGARVTIVEAASAPLVDQLGPDVAARAAGWIRAAGVRLLTGTAVTSLTTDAATGRVHAVLADGEHISADVAVDATGVVPATAWLSGSLPLTPGGGVLTDLFGRLIEGPASVRAVGDCATRVSPRDGVVPGGHWDAALHHPALVARAVLHPASGGANDADPMTIDPAPYVFSHQFGHDLTSVGHRRPGDRVLWRGGDDGPSTALFVHSDDVDQHTVTLHAAVTIDRPRDVGALRRILSNPNYPVLDLHLATDPNVPLKRAVAQRG